MLLKEEKIFNLVPEMTTWGAAVAVNLCSMVRIYNEILIHIMMVKNYFTLSYFGDLEGKERLECHDDITKGG